MPTSIKNMENESEIKNIFVLLAKDFNNLASKMNNLDKEIRNKIKDLK